MSEEDVVLILDMDSGTSVVTDYVKQVGRLSNYARTTATEILLLKFS